MKGLWRCHVGANRNHVCGTPSTKVKFRYMGDVCYEGMVIILVDLGWKDMQERFPARTGIADWKRKKPNRFIRNCFVPNGDT